jgi:hypothetical protein
MMTAVMPCSREPVEQVQWAVLRFLAANPGVQLTVLATGQAYEGLQGWFSARQVGYQVIGPDGLKNVANGAAWLHCWLAAALARSTTGYVVKLDPDTMCRAPAVEPTAGQYVGLPVVRYGLPRPNLGVVSHCAVAIHRDLVATLVTSQVFLDPRFADGTWRLNHAPGGQLASEEIAMAYALRDLGVSPTPWRQTIHGVSQLMTAPPVTPFLHPVVPFQPAKEPAGAAPWYRDLLEAERAWFQAQ